MIPAVILTSVDTLAQLLDWPIAALLVRLVLLSILAVIASRGYVWGLSLLWTSGADPGRRLASTIPALRLLLTLAVVFGSLHRFYVAQPAHAAALGVLIVVITATWGLRELQNVMAGLTLVLSRPIRPGDEAQCGDIRGVVVKIGLTRLTLTTHDGSRHELPTSLITRNGIRVAQAGRALPIAFEVPLPRDVDLNEFDLTSLRDEILLSTWVDVDAPVLLTRGAGYARVEATPAFPNEGPELVSDIRQRARSLVPIRRESEP